METEQMLMKAAETIERIAKDQDKAASTLSALQKSQDDLHRRMDEIEMKGDTPQLGGGTRKAPEGFRKYHTPKGPVFEIDSKASVADVLGEKKADVSFDRWLSAAVLGDRCPDREALEYAREIKSLGTGTSGILIPTNYMGTWIDVMRANSVLVAAGATTVPMNDKSVTWAALTADPTAAWHVEGASDVSATDPTFAARTLTAKTLAVRTQISMEVAQDSPDFGRQLARAFAKAMAVEVDRSGLHGASNGPAGLYGTSGVGTVASVGVPTDYAEMVSGLRTLLNANNRLEDVNKFAIMSPRTWQTYENLATGITNDKTPLERPRSLRDIQFLVTTSVSNTLNSPADDSTIFMGDFSHLYLGVRQDASIQVLQTTNYATSLILDVIGTMRVDWLVARPASFVTLNGVDD